MPLANAVAVSPAASSLVLLGDPQQLDQPITGSHPPGAAGSALGHLLAGRPTMPSTYGLFLERVSFSASALHGLTDVSGDFGAELGVAWSFDRGH